LPALPPPDGRLTARFYVEMGGGAAGWVEEMVDVRAPTDTTPMDPTNLAFLMSHGGDVTMKWLGPRALLIEYPGWATVSRGCRTARGVAISYVARATPDSAWNVAAHGEWQDDTLIQADQARCGEPPIRDKAPGLVGTCS
jgi:hypothetical protein